MRELPERAAVREAPARPLRPRRRPWTPPDRRRRARSALHRASGRPEARRRRRPRTGPGRRLRPQRQRRDALGRAAGRNRRARSSVRVAARRRCGGPSPSRRRSPSVWRGSHSASPPVVLRGAQSHPARPVLAVPGLDLTSSRLSRSFGRRDPVAYGLSDFGRDGVPERKASWSSFSRIAGSSWKTNRPVKTGFGPLRRVSVPFGLRSWHVHRCIRSAGAVKESRLSLC